MWILIFKGLNARRLYKSFGVKELTNSHVISSICTVYTLDRCFRNGGLIMVFLGRNTVIPEQKSVCDLTKRYTFYV
jgi:hypothetical protein